MTISLLKFITSLWKMLSFPILGERCRFYPTCSDYMVNAIEIHGFARGFGLGVKRVCRCHPLSKGGLDFVPDKITNI